MSTRAVYTFFDDEDDGSYHVYKHHDGYPSGAYEAITNALEYAWQLPRYEADEFAAAFVAGNKSSYKNQLLELLSKPKRTKAECAEIKHLKEMHEKGYSGGGIRLITPERGDMPAKDAALAFAGDIEFRYEIRCREGVLHITAFPARSEQEIFSGTLDEMKVWAEQNA